MRVSLTFQISINDREGIHSLSEGFLFQKDSMKAMMMADMWQKQLCTFFALNICAVLWLYFGEINHLACESTQGEQRSPI